MSTVTSTPIDREFEIFQQHRPSARGEPVWDLALTYPAQGYWTESDYLSLQASRLIEFSDGFIEVLPMPTYSHQLIVRWLLEKFLEHVRPRGLGDVVFAPLPVHLRPGKYREPDLVYLSRARLAAMGDYPEGADLALEVVSEGSEARERDLTTKKIEYAAAGIPEYWIVDPENREITVLVLDNGTYRTHGVFRGDDAATSVLLDGFAVQPADVFAAGERPASDG